MKKELLKRILGGLGSFVKDRGQYFNPESADFGELGTLIKGTSKIKPKLAQFGPTGDEAKAQMDYLFGQGIAQANEMSDYGMYDEALKMLKINQENLTKKRPSFNLSGEGLSSLRTDALSRFIERTDFMKYNSSDYLKRGEARDKYISQLENAFKNIAPEENITEFIEAVRKWQANTIGSRTLVEKFPTLMQNGGARGLGFRSAQDAFDENLFMGEKSLIGTLKSAGPEAKSLEVVTPESKVIKQASNFQKFMDEAASGTELTPNDIKRGIVKYYNEAYEPGSPKRISIDDDQAIESIIDLNMNYGKADKADFMQDIIREAYDMREETGDIQKLLDFSTKGRKPNAKGGRVSKNQGGILTTVAEDAPAVSNLLELQKSAMQQVPDPRNFMVDMVARPALRPEGDMSFVSKMPPTPMHQGPGSLNPNNMQNNPVDLQAALFGGYGLEANNMMPRIPLSGPVNTNLGPSIANMDSITQVLPDNIGQRPPFIPRGGFQHFGPRHFGPIVTGDNLGPPKKLPPAEGLQQSAFAKRFDSIDDKLTNIEDKIGGGANEIQPDDMGLPIADPSEPMKDVAKVPEATEELPALPGLGGNFLDFFKQRQQALGMDFNRFSANQGRQMFANNYNDGGRVKMSKAGSAGLMAILKKLGMASPDKVADKKQIENVIRDPKTDLERVKEIPDPTNPDVPMRKGTAPNQPTIDEIRDMIQNDPRYDKLTARQMDQVVLRETVRADFAYNSGVRPQDVPEEVIDMLIAEGYQSRFGFANGGGVGTLFKRKAV